MEQSSVNPEELWFNTPDTATLCRAGGNGPNHPSQLYAIKKYVKPDMSFLDYGCGSGTTLEALINDEYSLFPNDRDGIVAKGLYDPNKSLIYRGLDIIPKNIEWCRKQWLGGDFQINSDLHKISQSDKSWDVVYSRHVVDHMESFENALNEHCRVAKKFVIIVLWRPLGDKTNHDIKNIVENGKVYENEFTNDYSKPLVLKAIKEKEKDGWKLLELAEGVGKEVKGWDTVIVLKHE